jgi:hypothetical protein
MNNLQSHIWKNVGLQIAMCLFRVDNLGKQHPFVGSDVPIFHENQCGVVHRDPKK